MKITNQDIFPLLIVEKEVPIDRLIASNEANMIDAKLAEIHLLLRF